MAAHALDQAIIKERRAQTETEVLDHPRSLWSSSDQGLDLEEATKKGAVLPTGEGRCLGLPGALRFKVCFCFEPVAV